MDSSYISVIIFIVITALYYVVGKETIDSNGNLIEGSYTPLAIYFLITLIVQCIINSAFITQTCGGDIAKNIGSAIYMTAVPWILVFGVVIMVLIKFPVLKSAFSDVIGYFCICRQANSLLIEIFKPKDNENVKLTEAVTKLYDNKGILINEITPLNFNYFWDTVITNLMKEEIKNSPPQLNNYRTQLLQLVVMRDNIGEAIWYIYTAILLVSIVSLNIITKGCTKSLETVNAEKEEYDKQVAQQKEKENVGTGTVYKVGG